MARRTYAAAMEPAEGGYGVSFPDLPGCVSFGADFEDAVRQAEDALSLHMEGMVEDGEALPDASHFGDLMLAPEYGARNIVWALVSAEAPDSAERVNVYLPKSLLERVDRFAADAGLNRSTFFAQAARSYMAPSTHQQALAALVDKDLLGAANYQRFAVIGSAGAAATAMASQVKAMQAIKTIIGPSSAVDFASRDAISEWVRRIHDESEAILAGAIAETD